jgi:hypothetical protein
LTKIRKTKTDFRKNLNEMGKEKEKEKERKPDPPMRLH